MHPSLQVMRQTPAQSKRSDTNRHYEEDRKRLIVAHTAKSQDTQRITENLLSLEPVNRFSRLISSKSFMKDYYTSYMVSKQRQHVSNVQWI